jgi:2'-5' RNA ligase
MIRLFAALAPPPDLRQTLARLGGGLPGARWTPAENLHITLRFIGEVDELVADAVHEALSCLRAPAFTVELAGLGLFQHGRGTGNLWIGVAAAPPLVHLHDKIERAVVRAGLEPERRRFHPHISLARLKDTPSVRLQAFLAGNNMVGGTFVADRFALFSSRLGHGDPVYRVETEYPLEN